ncbi:MULTISPECIES: helix-turn-helix domain-containing protein [unclassified Spirosoma]|uniref:winged helix-turn-helix transcriptional regulator n=1 Tax=unclassified Spirosoma TaxID=2621999 RepID=UPI00095E12D8|nr:MULTISPECIES: helix-turn-helix domain-containing protein [unclassified Spirosoma]MBN8821745.1 helix-turn-helix transcriptional regulator [Spirosoma sp.]OJW80762.1 MAG: transcriptional regulator [Spirosoma sp. 48-14]
MNEPINAPKPHLFNHPALKKTLDIICGKWRLYIIYQIGTEARRYGELRRMIPEVSEKVLIQELKALVELGVIEKKSYNEVPPRVEYSLTATTLHIFPHLLELTAIGEAFLQP